MQNDAGDELLNKAQAAKLLSISTRTLERMLAAGKAPPSMIVGTGERRRRRLWSRREVMAWLKQQRDVKDTEAPSG
jgi:excisionase family DNA binding protein